MDKIHKSPSEKFPIEVNFSNDLASGEALSAFTLTCLDMASGANSAATIVDSSSRSGDIVTAVLKAGSIGGLHKITVKGQSDLGNFFEKEVYVEIAKPILGEFSKQPNDEFSIKMDFEEDLRNLSGESIVSATQEILDENGVDQAASMFSDDPLVDGDFVYCGVQAGSLGWYEIHVVVTTTSGYVFDIYVRMRVEEM